MLLINSRGGGLLFNEYRGVSSDKEVQPQVTSSELSQLLVNFCRKILVFAFVRYF